MSAEKPSPVQSPAAAFAGTGGMRLQAALRSALLRSLCYKLRDVYDQGREYRPPFRCPPRADVVAEMIGDMVGLTAEDIHLAFHDNDCTAGLLIEWLEPLLAGGYGGWITRGCL